MTGRLIVISGPSGVGKTTVCDALLGYPGFERVVTATSRSPRPGETEGLHYRFLSEAEFEAAIRRGEFLEWARVYGRLYGTPRAAVEAGLKAGRWLLLNIDVQGAGQIRSAVRRGERLPATFVFLEPPDWDELERRLRSRGTDSPREVEGRLETARRELEERRFYDLAVINDDVNRAVREILDGLGQPGKGPGRGKA